jgi:monoamine oxidase
MADVIVIGAGMAGVTAARVLARAGVSVRVVEGNDRIGGRIYSVRDFCGEPVEGGAEFVHGVGAETWPDVRAAGLSVRPCRSTRGTMNSDRACDTRRFRRCRLSATVRHSCSAISNWIRSKRGCSGC